jgi:hypothetical protein
MLVLGRSGVAEVWEVDEAEEAVTGAAGVDVVAEAEGGSR